MLNLKKVLKSYSETGSLNEQVNLYGFVDPHAFLTKSGDVGVILQVHGVDYECLDPNSLDTLTKRLESALKLFDENFRIYQYLFKRNNEPIPYKKYANPIVNTAIENRIRHFAEKSERLYSLQMFYVVVFEGFRYKRALLKSLTEFHKNPKKALEDLSAAFSSRRQVVLLDREITKALAALHQKVKSFILQVSDFVQVELLGKQDAFRVLKANVEFRAPEAPARTAQARHVSGLLPLRIASGMPSRAFEARRLLRQGLDPQRALGPELSAYLQKPSRSAG
jgi:type IV secretory pathway VirB4 component